MKLESMGDQAILARFEKEQEALQFTSQLRRQQLSWIVDIVQAYFTVAIYFDFSQIRFHDAVNQIHQMDIPSSRATIQGNKYFIPCCYDRQQDLHRIAEFTGLHQDEIIDLHQSIEYTVYAIGFCPGFPYLGYLPEQLCNVPRLESPRIQVEAGSIGLTGRQTGIYTEARPGGWNIIGQTPLELVNVEADYFPLQTGDRLQFTSIDEAEYQQLKGGRIVEVG